jgi:hypothetical protein
MSGAMGGSFPEGTAILTGGQPAAAHTQESREGRYLEPDAEMPMQSAATAMRE